MLERCPKASVWGPASPQVPVITFMGVGGGSQIWGEGLLSLNKRIFTFNQAKGWWRPKVEAIPCRTLNSKERKDVVRLGDPCEHVPGLTKDDPTQVPAQRPYEAKQIPRRIVAANQYT